MNSIPVGEIKALLQGRCPGLLHSLVPGLRREGNVFSAPNPTRAEKSRGSFKIWSNGAWKEYDSGEAGDVLGLIAYVAGYEPKSREGRRYAIGRAKEILGLDTGDRRQLHVARKQAAERQKTVAEEALARERFIADRVRSILAGAQRVDPADREHPAVAYLIGRGIDPALVANRFLPLLCHPNLQHWTERGHSGPALISPVMQASGAKSGLHAIFLAQRADGSWGKAVLERPKLMLGIVKGGVTPLTLGASGLTLGEASAQGQRGPVLLCEGRETGEALAIAAPDARIWCCLSLSNIAEAPVGHDAINGIIVALENDTKVQALKMRAKVLAALEGYGKPLVTMEPHVGSDFADVLAQGALADEEENNA